MPNNSDVKSKIHAKDIEISVISSAKKDDYISLTDIARYRNSEYPGYVIQNWLRNRATVDYLGLWEEINNPSFNYLEFEAIKNEAGANSFVLTPKKWVDKTNAIGIITKQGRYAATYAHRDIAFEFASWISPEFKLYVIQDYQRLKSDESHRYALDWNVKRLLSKANYRIHTDAIKQNLIPPEVTGRQQSFIYANEADLLNIALFGKTATEWRNENPDKKGENIRDYATIEQLLVLANLENTNALLIEQGLPPELRLKKLNEIAIQQLTTLTKNKSVEKLKALDGKPQLSDKN